MVVDKWCLQTASGGGYYGSVNINILRMEKEPKKEKSDFDEKLWEIIEQQVLESKAKEGIDAYEDGNIDLSEEKMKIKEIIAQEINDKYNEIYIEAKEIESNLDIEIEAKTKNGSVEGSSSYEETEKFFREELPKYDDYVRKNAKKLLPYVIAITNKYPYYNGFMKHAMFDDIPNCPTYFSSSWKNPNGLHDEYIFSMDYIPFNSNGHAEWMVYPIEKNKDNKKE